MKMTTVAAAIAALALGACSSSSAPSIDAKRIAPATFAIVVPQGLGAGELPELARQKCAGQQICQLFAWPAGQSPATAMPLTDREASSLVFSYSLNRMTGLERSLWRCSSYRRAAKNECL